MRGRRRHRCALHQRGGRRALALLRRADGGTTREAVDVLDAAGGHLAADIEGVTLVDQDNGDGYLIVSAQNVVNPNASYFSVYRRRRQRLREQLPGVQRHRLRRLRPHRRRHGHDGATRRSVPARHVRLPGQQQRPARRDRQPGPQDGPPREARGPRRRRAARLRRPRPRRSRFVGQATRNTNSTSFTVPVPGGVQAGDPLLLFASQGSTATQTGPGAGWTQVGRVVDGSMATTVWRRAAGAGGRGNHGAADHGEHEQGGSHAGGLPRRGHDQPGRQRQRARPSRAPPARTPHPWCRTPSPGHAGLVLVGQERRHDGLDRARRRDRARHQPRRGRGRVDALLTDPPRP